MFTGMQLRSCIPLEITDFHEGFLSKDMTYSCAIFDDLDGDLHSSESQSPVSPTSPTSPLSRASSPTAFSSDTEDHIFSKVKAAQRCLFSAESSADFSDPLYTAQIRKFEHLIRKADIRPGHRVSIALKVLYIMSDTFL